MGLAASSSSASSAASGGGRRSNVKRDSSSGVSGDWGCSAVIFHSSADDVARQLRSSMALLKLKDLVRGYRETQELPVEGLMVRRTSVGGMSTLWAGLG